MPHHGAVDDMRPRPSFPVRVRRLLTALVLVTAGCAQGSGPVTAVRAGNELEAPQLPGVPGEELPDLPGAPGIEGPEVPGAISSEGGGGPSADGTGCGPMILYALAAPGGSPSGVAAGDAGSVWFTDPATSSIGHLEVDGTVRRYALLPGRRPGPIARAANGDLWFTDQSGPRIGRMTPAGVVSEFPLPTVEGNPMGIGGVNAAASIIAGGDEAMWFTEAAADKVGRITPEGVVSEFPLPRRERMHAYPTGIAAGPDGAVWFSEPLFGIIARIDVGTHAIKEFPIPRDGRGVWWEPTASPAGRRERCGTRTPAPRPSAAWAPTGPCARSASRIPSGNRWRSAPAPTVRCGSWRRSTAR